jgi:predicted metal-dependent hydrolase
VKHGYEHEQFCKVLEVHGYSIQPFLSLYNRIAFGFLEKLMSPALCLSITVALEHVTAVLSERALASNFLDQAHPMMRDLFRWHAAEEIEHKNVAFDVLKTVNDSYILRIAGMMMGLCLFFIIWFWAIFTLFFQETEIAPSRMLIDILSGIRVGLIGRGEIACAMLQYMHPGFHPNDIDNATLAEDFGRMLVQLSKANWLRVLLKSDATF